MVLKKRKTKQQIAESEKQLFLKLPLINENDLSPATIAEYINNDIPIVAVFYPVTKEKWDINSLSRIQRKRYFFVPTKKKMKFVMQKTVLL